MYKCVDHTHTHTHTYVEGSSYRMCLEDVCTFNGKTWFEQY